MTRGIDADDMGAQMVRQQPAYTSASPNVVPIGQIVWNETADGIDEIIKDIDEGQLDATPGYRDLLLGVAKSMRGDATEE